MLARWTSAIVPSMCSGTQRKVRFPPSQPHLQADSPSYLHTAGNKIATAATNGAIVVWNVLQRDGRTQKRGTHTSRLVNLYPILQFFRARYNGAHENGQSHLLASRQYLQSHFWFTRWVYEALGREWLVLQLADQFLSHPSSPFRTFATQAPRQLTLMLSRLASAMYSLTHFTQTISALHLRMELFR